VRVPDRPEAFEPPVPPEREIEALLREEMRRISAMAEWERTGF
jgi:hypothetical protein